MYWEWSWVWLFFGWLLICSKRTKIMLAQKFNLMTLINMYTLWVQRLFLTRFICLSNKIQQLGSFFEDRNVRIYLQINFDSLWSGIIIGAAPWHHMSTRNTMWSIQGCVWNEKAAHRISDMNNMIKYMSNVWFRMIVHGVDFFPLNMMLIHMNIYEGTLVNL